MFKIREKFIHTVLRTTSLKTTCDLGHIPSASSKEESGIGFSSFWWISTIFNILAVITVSLLALPVSSQTVALGTSVRPHLLQRPWSLHLVATLNQNELLLINHIHFQMKLHYEVPGKQQEMWSSAVSCKRGMIENYREY